MTAVTERSAFFRGQFAIKSSIQLSLTSLVPGFLLEKKFGGIGGKRQKSLFLKILGGQTPFRGRQKSFWGSLPSLLQKAGVQQDSLLVNSG